MTQSPMRDDTDAQRASAPDYYDRCQQIFATVAKAARPLTASQKSLLTGAISAHFQMIEQAAQACWRPISRRELPFSLDDDRPFAVMNSNHYCGCATYIHNDFGAYYHTAEEEVQICSGVTHWMPLPPPPENANG